MNRRSRLFSQLCLAFLFVFGMMTLVSCNKDASTAPIAPVRWKASFQVDSSALSDSQVALAKWIRLEARQEGVLLESQEYASEDMPREIALTSSGDVDLYLIGYPDIQKEWVIWNGSASVTFGNQSTGSTVVKLVPGIGLTEEGVMPIPEFELFGGTYSTPQSVTITHRWKMATIYYTTDGSEPTTASSAYAGPIEISATTTIKAIAYYQEYPQSRVNEATFTINKKLNEVSAVEFSPKPGTYRTIQNVVLSTSTSGATIYYTLDGSTPTTSSMKYSGPIVLKSNAVLQAIAIKKGQKNSSISTGEYNVYVESSSSAPWKTGVKYGSVKDAKGNTYRVVTIGWQRWMAENLNYAGVNGKAGICVSNNQDSCKKYGRLYTWTEALGLPDSCSSKPCHKELQKVRRGLCPEGWHVPRKVEWDGLNRHLMYAGSLDEALKSQQGWLEKIYRSVPQNNNGTDSLGFRALPSGGYVNGAFVNQGNSATYLTATPQGSFVNIGDDYVDIDSSNKMARFALRCLQSDSGDYPLENEYPEIGEFEASIDESVETWKLGQEIDFSGWVTDDYGLDSLYVKVNDWAIDDSLSWIKKIPVGGYAVRFGGENDLKISIVNNGFLKTTKDSRITLLAVDKNGFRREKMLEFIQIEGADSIPPSVTIAVGSKSNAYRGSYFDADGIKVYTDSQAVNASKVDDIDLVYGYSDADKLDRIYTPAAALQTGSYSILNGKGSANKSVRIFDLGMMSEEQFQMVHIKKQVDSLMTNALSSGTQESKVGYITAKEGLVVGILTSQGAKKLLRVHAIRAGVTGYVQMKLYK